MNLKMIFILILSLFATFDMGFANTECVWATGKVLCKKDQALVKGTVVDLFDLDSPQGVRL